jgi:hypothetical protein
VKAVRPPELRAGNDDTRGDTAHHLGAQLLGRPLHFVGRAEHDVPFDDRQTVDHDILHGFGGEVVASNQRRLNGAWPRLKLASPCIARAA